MTDSINTYPIRDIFHSGKYIIPIYQRNYAWAEPEISQLIQDIYDFSKEKSTSNYYIGTLVVFERVEDNGDIAYEAIDGQQRLTTLNILVSALNRLFEKDLSAPIDYQLNLSFDSRKKSTDTLDVLARESEELQYDNSKDYNPNIQQAYRDVQKKLETLLNTQSEIDEFYNYLADKVHLMRVSVPRDTDLNHYFEIMNTRGEQLEKHEILKAQLMEVIKKDEAMSYTFNLIWEACADMERYVQYGFNTEQRGILFTKKNWNTITFNDLDEVAEDVFNKRNTDTKTSGVFKGNLQEIVEHPSTFVVDENQKEDAPDRFTSIINFSNFLLHVLRIQTEEDISLDDKRLITLFKEQLDECSSKEKVEFVKDFGANLLWCKWLFDNYIIKREFIREKDQWSLKKLKWYPDRKIKSGRVSYVNTFGEEEGSSDKNRQLIMLLSMFHVSTPTLVYKHWLNAALYYVFCNYDEGNQEPINQEQYTDYLINLAKAFLFDRYLCKESEKAEFYDLIYENDGVSQNDGDDDSLDLKVLDSGTKVENFVFNYLDYLLWKEQVSGFDKFEFAFRSSVEHYFPQNPIAKDQKIDQSICDQFGNLCLISSSKNSKLSNHLPEAKKDYYVKAGVDSLKQSEMMKVPVWDEEQINIHGEKMIAKLLGFSRETQPKLYL